MNNAPICVGAGDSQFGSFSVPFNGQLASVKLIHLDGYVRCNQSNWSFWGCRKNPGPGVNVQIRNVDDKPLLPSLCGFSGGGEHIQSLQWIPGYWPFSPELVLSACSNPPNVTKGQWLHLWYGKAVTNLRGGNGGKSCCDVYARLT